MRLEPQSLQSGVVERWEGVWLEDTVEFLEVSAVEGDNGFGFEHALVLVKMFTRRQGPEEAS